MNALITVPFHNDTLFIVDHNGQPYIPMKPIVESMGLDWKSQYDKLTSNPRFCMVEITMQMPNDDQKRNVCCMPLRKLCGWLLGISPSKVSPDIQDKVIAYQNECDDVLYDYWTNGRPQDAQIIANLRDHLIVSSNCLAKILYFRQQQYPEGKIARLLNLSVRKIERENEKLEQCGLLPSSNQQLALI